MAWATRSRDRWPHFTLYLTVNTSVRSGSCVLNCAWVVCLHSESRSRPGAVNWKKRIFSPKLSRTWVYPKWEISRKVIWPRSEQSISPVTYTTLLVAWHIQFSREVNSRFFLSGHLRLSEKGQSRAVSRCISVIQNCELYSESVPNPWTISRYYSDGQYNGQESFISVWWRWSVLYKEQKSNDFILVLLADNNAFSASSVAPFTIAFPSLQLESLSLNCLFCNVQTNLCSENNFFTFHF